MKIALFCHSEHLTTEFGTQMELQRQCRFLEDYAMQQGHSIEHCFFHTGAFDFNAPDNILRCFLQCAQEKEFEQALVESMERFPRPQPDMVPPISLFFVKEAMRCFVGSSQFTRFTRKPEPTVKTDVYWGLEQE